MVPSQLPAFHLQGVGARCWDMHIPGVKRYSTSTTSSPTLFRTSMHSSASDFRPPNANPPPTQKLADGDNHRMRRVLSPTMEVHINRIRPWTVLCGIRVIASHSKEMAIGRRDLKVAHERLTRKIPFPGRRVFRSAFPDIGDVYGVRGGFRSKVSVVVIDKILVEKREELGVNRVW